MRTFPNKYAKACVTCSTQVVIGAGYCHGEPGNWKTYCEACVPVKIEAPKRVLTADGKCITPYEPHNLDLFRSFPGARFSKEPEAHWQVSLKMGDRKRVLEIADQLKLDVAEELRDYEETAQSLVAHAAGLYPFQVDGVDWLAHGDRRLLGDDMGLGKTVQSLVALGEGVPGIAVVPANVKYNWADEAAKWTPGLKISVLNGRNSFRLPQKGELVVTNYELLPKWLEPVKRTPSSEKWDTEVQWPNHLMKKHAATCVLIVDEAHKVKNFKTQRSKRVNGLARSVAKVWALTGTPLENRQLDLYGVLSSLDMAQVTFGKASWKNFLRYFNGRPGKWGYEFGMPEPIVPELLKRVMLRRERSEVLPDLPKKTYTTVKVDVDGKLAREMDELWDEFHGMLEGEMGNRKLPPFERFSEIRAKLATARIPAVVEMVEDHEEQDVPLVVFSAHTAPCDALAKRDGWEKITGEVPAAKRQQIVRDFQAGRLKGVACTIRAAGVGLTLTRAWKMLKVDLDWVPGANWQAEDRICRIGQESQHVEIVRFVSNHELELHVHDLLAYKVALIAAALESSLQAIVLDQKSETEAEYQARMKRLAETDTGQPRNEVEASWLPIEADLDIPF